MDDRDFFELSDKEKRKYWRRYGKLPLEQFYIVLDYFLRHPHQKFTGWQIMEVTKLGAGTVYPLLVRMVTKGWLESEEEVFDITYLEMGPETKDVTSKLHRPPRTFFFLSKAGGKKGRKCLERRESKNSSEIGDMIPAPA